MRKTLIRNKRAYYEYHILEKLETGIVLSGTEVKSMRARQFSFSDSYAQIIRGEAWLIGLHINEYSYASRFNHIPLSKRKLLCHKREILHLQRQTAEKGHTLIPLECYLVGALIKVELAICRGKKLYDKREYIKEKDQKREADRERKKYV